MAKGTEDLLANLTMSTAGSAASEETKSSSSTRRPRTGSRRPSHVLLNVDAVVGIHRNRTTATTFNRKGALIQVSFLLKPPPEPSIVYVASDDLNPFVGPVVLCSVDDLLLLRVNVGRKDGHIHLKHDHDYYVYRAAAKYPSLHLLESPPVPVFHGEDVGLLPRPDGRHYTVAALMHIGRNDVYKLQLYHSETSTWTTREVFVEPRQWDPLPKRIPKYCDALLRHYTSAVVAIGGEGGTMAWIDLWRSILLCDVLRPDSSLRGVPIPLPSRQMSLNDGLGVKLDFGGHSRGISFNRDKECLMLVHLERNESPPPIRAATRGLHGEIQVLDWEVTTWSSSKMSDSLEDWHKEHSVQASNFTIDTRILKGSGLPCRPTPRDHSNDQAAAAQAQQQLQFHNLSICQPTLCPNGTDDIVYLVAREKYLHPKAWFLAVDMKKQGTLKRAVCFGNQHHPLFHGIYCLSRISKYMNPIRDKKKKGSPTEPGEAMVGDTTAGTSWTWATMDGVIAAMVSWAGAGTADVTIAAASWAGASMVGATTTAMSWTAIGGMASVAMADDTIAAASWTGVASLACLSNPPMTLRSSMKPRIGGASKPDSVSPKSICEQRCAWLAREGDSRGGLRHDGCGRRRRSPLTGGWKSAAGGQEASSGNPSRQFMVVLPVRR